MSRHLPIGLPTIAVLAALVAALGASGTARAHSRSTSHGEVILRDDGATIRVRLSALDLEALREGRRPDDRWLADHLGRTVALSAGDATCAPEPGSFAPLETAPGFGRWEWRVRCAQPPDAIRSRPVPRLAGHLSLMRVRWQGRAATEELVLSERAPGAALPGPSADGSPRSAVVRFVPVGVEHILSGFDHLAFLAMLLLLAGTLRECAVLVTGFTVGHSVTLAAAALGVVRPEATAVEALIGLSVALVAAENVWLQEERRGRAIPLLAVAIPATLGAITGQLAFLGVALFAGCHFGLLAGSDRPGRWRWALAGLFGLLHGFGFAGVLGEGGLEGTDAVGSLLGFNLGVELGQLGVVALAWPILAWARRRGEAPARLLVGVGSALGAAAGTFWLLSRALG